MPTAKDSKKTHKKQRFTWSWGKIFHVASRVLIIMILVLIIVSVVLVPLLSVIQ